MSYKYKDIDIFESYESYRQFITGIIYKFKNEDKIINIDIFCSLENYRKLETLSNNYIKRLRFKEVLNEDKLLYEKLFGEFFKSFKHDKGNFYDNNINVNFIGDNNKLFTNDDDFIVKIEVNQIVKIYNKQQILELINYEY